MMRVGQKTDPDRNGARGEVWREAGARHTVVNDVKARWPRRRNDWWWWYCCVVHVRKEWVFRLIRTVWVW